MANTVRLVDGPTEVVLRPAYPGADDAVYLSELDLGYPDVRAVVQDLAGQDGVLDLTTHHGARTITAKAKIRGNATLGREALADTLRALSSPGRRPYLYVNRDGWDSERRAQLRGNPYSCVWTQRSAAYLEVSLSWSCPGGLLEAVDYIEVPISPPAASGTGLAFAPADLGTAADPPAVGMAGLGFAPADLGTAADPPAVGTAGLGFAPGSDTNQAVVTNPGTAPASPTLMVVGQCSAPALYNRTTGRQLVMPAATVPAGHYLLVDVRARSALLDGDPAQPFDSKINWASSDWLVLAPGENQLEFDATNMDTSCYLGVRFLPRWY